MTLDQVKKQIEDRIASNKSIISNKLLLENHDLEVENTALEYVLMLIEWEAKK